jgi:hypothetical protein
MTEGPQALSKSLTGKLVVMLRALNVPERPIPTEVRTMYLVLPLVLSLTHVLGSLCVHPMMPCEPSLCTSSFSSDRSVARKRSCAALQWSCRPVRLLKQLRLSDDRYVGDKWVQKCVVCWECVGRHWFVGGQCGV